ncbi:diguanylate cyclase [Thalassotalea sp. PLHSN55]|uniref:GGDEF domain-containing protein n=1 Tax=Thalassotalea sp. PLHSN55 TaxID=3435888 RepID=UPI003F83E806
MVTDDNFQQATQLSFKAQSFLEKRAIAPTPINFSVLYLYYSQQNSELSSALDKAIKDSTQIDAFFLESLFSEYISNSSSLEKNVLAPFESTLKMTLASINTQVENEQEALFDLEKVDKALAKMSQHKSLHSVVNFLVKSVNDSQQQRKVLTDQLNKTSDEVNSLRNQLEQSKQEANIDTLTGLFNRRGCEQKLKELKLTDVHSSLIIDIDHFKKVNDNFGHFIGDKVIQHVAKIIENNIDSEDIAVRYGGEEFLVVMAHKSIDKAHYFAEKIRNAVGKLKLVQKQTSTSLPPISVSIGVAELEDDNDWLSLFKRSDKALYRAKNSGRNCCVLADKIMA